MFISIGTGSISVFVLLLVFQENIKPADWQILGLQEPVQLTSNSPNLANATNSQGQRGSGQMTTPVMIFLSIEPFEVRQEILVQANIALKSTGINNRSLTDISIESQDELKKKLENELLESSTIRIDGKIAKPKDKKTEFVTMSRGGVSVRSAPVEEDLASAIIGITFIYETRALPDSIMVNWKFFPDTMHFVEASAVDPHGAFTIELNPEDNVFKWANRLKGFQVPVIEAVMINKPSYPLISILIWTVILFFTLYRWIMHKSILRKYWIISLSVLGFICYPFLRTDVGLSFVNSGKPTVERTHEIMNELLTNVYRAFDRRKEEDVYDYLAMSVKGDQLTDIYIQNRKALELENKGGAMVSVEEVKILKIFDVEQSENGTVLVDALWTVSGSVNHFGHTHYRQNQYRAELSLIEDKDAWKINQINAIDEQRIY